MDPDDRLREQIAAEAAEWFVTLQDARGAARVDDEFAQWLLRSPAHVEEYLAAARLWGDVDGLDDSSVADLVQQAREEPEPESANVVAFSAAVPARQAASVQPSGLSRPGRRERIALPAIAATALIAIAGWLGSEALRPARIETAIGEQRSVALADGSVVHLNTDSKVSVDIGEHARRIKLLRGEARFTVAKDPQRPFFVTTPQATVRAVGTVFNVRALGERTAVTVIEGRVAVTSGAAVMESRPRSNESKETGVANRVAEPSVPALELAAGQLAAVTASGQVLPDVGPSVERALAWSERRLVFRDEPLAEVIAEFNRYHEHAIHIEDASLARTRISGSFSSSDPQSLIQYLERYERVQVREEANGERALARTPAR
jgi:transmembrane sensor